MIGQSGTWRKDVLSEEIRDQYIHTRPQLFHEIVDERHTSRSLRREIADAQTGASGPRTDADLPPPDSSTHS
jgi:hypothetical protein